MLLVNLTMFMIFLLESCIELKTLHIRNFIGSLVTVFILDSGNLVLMQLIFVLVNVKARLELISNDLARMTTDYEYQSLIQPIKSLSRIKDLMALHRQLMKTFKLVSTLITVSHSTTIFYILFANVLLVCGFDTRMAENRVVYHMDYIRVLYVSSIFLMCVQVAQATKQMAKKIVIIAYRIMNRTEDIDVCEKVGKCNCCTNYLRYSISIFSCCYLRFK